MPFGRKTFIPDFSSIASANYLAAANIPGHAAWIEAKCRARNESLPLNSKRVPVYKETGVQLQKNEKLVDNINAWIDGNGWQYVEGVEHDGCWVNPAYPKRVFAGEARAFQVSNGVMEMVEFPVSTHAKDPRGLACYIGLERFGLGASITPNKWLDYSTGTKRGRRDARYVSSHLIRRHRWEKYQELNELTGSARRSDAAHKAAREVFFCCLISSTKIPS